MDTIDLKAFRRANKLTQSELGEFLGIQKPFISRIENGKDKLPQGKLRKLIDNPHGWDVSALTLVSSKVMQTPITVPVPGISKMRANYGAFIDKTFSPIEILNRKDKEIIDLNRTIWEYEHQVADLQKIIDDLKQKLAEKSGNDAD